MRIINQAGFAFAVACLSGCGNGDGGSGGGEEPNSLSGPSLGGGLKPVQMYGSLSVRPSGVKKRLLSPEDQASVADSIVEIFKGRQVDGLKEVASGVVFPKVNAVIEAHERELKRLRQEADTFTAELDVAGLGEAKIAEARDAIEKVRVSIESRINNRFDFDLKLARNEEARELLQNAVHASRFRTEIESMLRPFSERENDVTARRLVIDALREALEEEKQHLLAQHSDMTGQDKAQLEKIIQAYIDNTAANREFMTAVARMRQAL